MKQSLWQRLDTLARNLSPFGLTLLLIIVGMVPLRIPQLSPVLPALTIIAVYYWSIHRPDLMPIWAVFLIGLIQDLLGAGPMGAGILSLLVVYAIVDSQRRFFASGSFSVLWWAFALVAAAAAFVTWLLNCLFQGFLLDPRPALFQYLMTIAFYPCLSWLFARAQRSLLRQAG